MRRVVGTSWGGGIATTYNDDTSGIRTSFSLETGDLCGYLKDESYRQFCSTYILRSSHIHLKIYRCCYILTTVICLVILHTTSKWNILVVDALGRTSVSEMSRVRYFDINILTDQNTLHQHMMQDAWCTIIGYYWEHTVSDTLSRFPDCNQDNNKTYSPQSVHNSIYQVNYLSIRDDQTG